MGTIGVHIGRLDNENKKNTILSDWDLENFELVKSSFVGSVFYALLKEKKTGQTFIQVVKTYTNSKDFYNFYYKTYSACDMPFFFDCPTGMLKEFEPCSDKCRCVEYKDACEQYKNYVKEYNSLPCGSKVEIHGRECEVGLWADRKLIFATCSSVMNKTQGGCAKLYAMDKVFKNVVNKSM